jgi:hypothetical protein
MKTLTNIKSINSLRASCLTLLAAVTLVFAPQPATAKDQVPFRADFNTVFESTLNFPFISVHVTGDGEATHLGRTAIETTDQVGNVLTGATTATYHLTAANGDEVVVEFYFLALPTQTGFTFAGTWEITGGTGRFTNASGSGTIEGRADFTSATGGVGQFTMIGTISSPGSLQ